MHKVEFGILIWSHRRKSWGLVKPYHSNEKIHLSFSCVGNVLITPEKDLDITPRDLSDLPRDPRRRQHFAFVRGRDDKNRECVLFAVDKNEWKKVEQRLRLIKRGKEPLSNIYEFPQEDPPRKKTSWKSGKANRNGGSTQFLPSPQRYHGALRVIPVRNR